MIGQNSHSNIGETEIDTEDSPIGAVIEFLDANLTDFPSDFIKRPSESDKIDENLISQELEIFLKRRSSDKLFWFKGQWEYPDDSNRKPDFGTYLVEDRNPFGLTKAFFELEAKVLPTGSKDYVKGNQGGIERFKRGHHGKGLLKSAMIGYIRENDCSYWFKKINEWINNLITNNMDTNIHWDSQDLLIETDTFNTTKKYTSKNTRIVNSFTDSIRLYHYLMELS